MSLSYTPSSIVGGPLSDDVIKLLQQRQEIFGKLDRTDKELVYLNSNTGWVKLSSSVDTRGRDKKYTSDLAKKYTLLGGALYNDAMRTGLLPDTEAGRSSYELSKTFGYVPMPGISAFEVQTKNTFGTLRAATLEFKANSIEQLSILEQLYLRPGFTVLLEWGHSIFLNSKGQVSTNVQTIGDNYFNLKTKESIVEEIQRLKKLGNNNYDAMYGFIKNFTWSYSENGEYDCKIDVISTGEIVESLELAIFSGADVEDDDIQSLNQVNTKLHKYFYEILNLQGSSDVTKLGKVFDPVKTALQENGREFKIYTLPVRTEEENANGDKFFKYIPLSNVLACINEAVTLKSSSGKIVSFYTGKGSELLTPFTTFIQHFILDPYIGFFPKGSKTSKFGYEFATLASDLEEYSDILNICVNVNFLVEILNRRLSISDPSQHNVHDYIKDILGAIQESSGNINEFDLHYEDEEFLFYVIDRKIVPSRKPLLTSNSIINVIGLGSTVENLSLASKLTNRITSMVAISAQANTSDAGEDLLNLQRWNYGLVDRTLTEKFYNTTPEQKEKEFEVYRILQLVSKSYHDQLLYYNPTDILGAKAVHKKLMVQILEMSTVKQQENAPGLIPLELSITLKGIAGLKVGQAFLIPTQILPERYREEGGDINDSKVAFLITSLNHRVDENKWVTEIGTQMILTTTKQEGVVSNLDLDDEIIAQSDVLYDPQEIPSEGPVLAKPIAGMSKSSIRNDRAGAGTFMSRRGYRLHKGLDIKAEPGTPVRAPFNGKVTFGKTQTLLPKIIIEGISGYEKYKAILHYVTPGPGIIDGGVVAIGQTIGKMADLKGDGRPGSGYQDARDGIMLNHLDIKLEYNGRRADPEVEFFEKNTI